MYWLLAAPADPGGTGSAMSEVGSGVESWVASFAVPVILSLLLLGAAVVLLVRFVRRAPMYVGLSDSDNAAIYANERYHSDRYGS